MQFLDIRSDDPAICLATEEYLLNKSTDRDIFMLWSGRPSVIYGKFQNPFEEVSVTECRKRGVGLYRRCSGGGTVFHDLGNINYSIISARTGETGYERFLSYPVAFLNSLGAGAYQENNMIKIGDFKISGNAQANTASGVLHHGTLLFECDLGTLHSLTQGSRSKFSSKAIKSNPHPVCNIRPCLSRDLQVSEFKSLFAGYMAGYDSELTLSEEDTFGIEKLAAEKYRSWEWNVGRTPDFSLTEGDLSAEAHRGRFTKFSVGSSTVPEMIGSRLSQKESETILSKVFPETFALLLNAIYN